MEKEVGKTSRKKQTGQRGSEVNIVKSNEKGWGEPEKLKRKKKRT